MRFLVIFNTLLSLLRLTRPVLNSCVLRRFHLLEHDQCFGILRRLTSSESNQGFIHRKSLYLACSAVMESKSAVAILRKGRIFIPGNQQKKSRKYH